MSTTVIIRGKSSSLSTDAWARPTQTSRAADTRAPVRVGRGCVLETKFMYDTLDGRDRSAIFTDSSETERTFSVSPGRLRDPIRHRQRERAATLPPVFETLVGETSDLFVQAIYDLTVPSMVTERVCLLGDGAFVARPHTAAGQRRRLVMQPRSPTPLRVTNRSTKHSPHGTKHELSTAPHSSPAENRWVTFS